MDLVCLSHLRWDFVYQRPQHLMTRFAREGRVFFVEEPVPDSALEHIELNERSGVTVVKMHVPPGLDGRAIEVLQRRLLDSLFREHQIHEYVLWFYSPMQLRFTRHLLPGAAAVVYDCMDELANFWNVPSEVREREIELLGWADVAFTGGLSLYDAKRHLHGNLHAFPSSVDVAHFVSARDHQEQPADQERIPVLRIGYYGVVDERMDLELLDGMARLRPDWQFVIVGEVVKIREAVLPRHPNLHYLGLKRYGDLPAYLSGWEAAILPFSRNDATRFISPTKIPEYLAAGRPVVSTSIPDVVRTYCDRGLARIADTPEDFVTALEQAMAEREDPAYRARVDAFLAGTSWDSTWSSMNALVKAAIVANRELAHESAQALGSS